MARQAGVSDRFHASPFTAAILRPERNEHSDGKIMFGSSARTNGSKTHQPPNLHISSKYQPRFENRRQNSKLFSPAAGGGELPKLHVLWGLALPHSVAPPAFNLSVHAQTAAVVSCCHNLSEARRRRKSAPQLYMIALVIARERNVDDVHRRSPPRVDSGACFSLCSSDAMEYMDTPQCLGWMTYFYSAPGRTACPQAPLMYSRRYRLPNI